MCAVNFCEYSRQQEMQGFTVVPAALEALVALAVRGGQRRLSGAGKGPALQPPG